MRLTEELIRKYLDNQCTPEEEKWISEALSGTDDDSWNFIFEQYWKKGPTGPTLTKSEKTSVFANIKNKIQPDKQSRSVFMPVWRWAASIAFLLVASGTVLVFQDDIKTYIAAQTILDITAKPGTIKAVTLPDKSKVWINAGSTLRYNRFFWSGRDVELTGEAFFEVKKDPDHPFIVHSGTKQTKVLGTSFNVKAINKLALYQVTVSSGKVQVSDGDTLIATLLPHERLTLIYNGSLLETTKVKGDQFQSWRSGRFTFQNQSFEEIAWYMENYFNVTIHLKGDTLKQRRFTGDFTGMSLSQILEVMQEAYPFKWTKKDNALNIAE